MVKAILAGTKTQTRRCHVIPRYAVGDRLWVREALGVNWNEAAVDVGMAHYRRDGELVEPLLPWRWKRNYLSPIHMPKEAARIWLKVTEVRVERLNDISMADALAEGIVIPVDTQRRPLIRVTGRYPASDYIPRNPTTKQIVIGYFASLWDTLNAERGFGWVANPWVAVYDFEREVKP